MQEESIENITKSDTNFPPTFVDHHLLPAANFNGNCLIKNNISIPKKSIYFLDTRFLIKNLNKDFTLASVKLAKDADPDKYKYTGYSIAFDSRSEFLFMDESYGKMLFLLIIKKKIS